MDSVTHDLRAYERNEQQESSAYKEAVADFICDLLCDPLRLAELTGVSMSEAMAITRLYQALPMKNGERILYTGSARVELLAWNLIDAITQNDVIQDAATDYAAMVTGC